MHYITLVSSSTPLSTAHIAEIETELDNIKIPIDKAPQWLNKHKAADLQILTKPDKLQLDKMREILADDKIDIFCTSSKNRRKKLIIADMDATIVKTETLDELAEHAGIKDQISEITVKAMNGEINFKNSLKQRIALLKDLPVAALQETLNNIETSDGAKTLIRTMKKHGAKSILISGGFTFFTGPIAQQVHFHAHHGNIFEIKEDKLTGKTIEPILDKNSKLEYMIEYAKELKLDISETMAIGDGANDLPMLEYANLGIGYQPKQLLKDNLENFIIYGDLTAALYAQGYKIEEFM